MAAYCLFDNLEITDHPTLEKYKALVAPTVKQYGGQYVVLGGRTVTVEGDWKPIYPVMLQFPSMDHAQRWYNSPEYRDLKKLRLASGRFSAVIIEGL